MIDMLRRLWNRPIADSERVPIFAGCAVLLVGAALALGLLRDSSEPTDAQLAARDTTAAEVPAAESSEESPSDSTDPVTTATTTSRASFGARRRQLAQAERAARRFLAGYLPYSYGRGEMTAAAGSIASPALADELAASPPRVPADVQELTPRISALQAETVAADSIEFVALIDDGERSYSLAMALEPSGRAWQVTGLGG